MYTSLTAMIVESAALPMVPYLMYLVCYAIGSSFGAVVLSVVVQSMVRQIDCLYFWVFMQPLFQQLIRIDVHELQCIAPELIILRVALGHACQSHRAATQPASVHLIARGGRSVLDESGTTADVDFGLGTV